MTCPIATLCSSRSTIRSERSSFATIPVTPLSRSTTTCPALSVPSNSLRLGGFSALTVACRILPGHKVCAVSPVRSVNSSHAVGARHGSRSSP